MAEVRNDEQAEERYAQIMAENAELKAKADADAKRIAELEKQPAGGAIRFGIGPKGPLCIYGFTSNGMPFYVYLGQLLRLIGCFPTAARWVLANQDTVTDLSKAQIKYLREADEDSDQTTTEFSWAKAGAKPETVETEKARIIGELEDYLAGVDALEAIAADEDAPAAEAAA